MIFYQTLTKGTILLGINNLKQQQLDGRNRKQRKVREKEDERIITGARK